MATDPARDVKACKGLGAREVAQPGHRFHEQPRFFPDLADGRRLQRQARFDAPFRKGHRIAAESVRRRHEPDATIGFAQDGATLTRTYAFDGVSGSQQLADAVDQSYALPSAFSDPRSPTCGDTQRVTYVIDLAADLLSENTFFQVDSVDVDTSFRFGTDWASCDPADPLTVAPSQPGEFCDGPNQQPCAEGLLCDRESAPNNNEGTCFVP